MTTVVSLIPIKASKLFAILLLTISLTFPPTVVSIYGQQETQEESEGDLEAVLNGEVFTTGQTITISGSVDDPGDQPLLDIEVVDPEGSVVARGFPEITADDTFTFSFEAGGRDNGGDEPMNVGGNYRVTVTYFPSFTSMDEVDFEFEYIVTPTSEEGAGDNGGGGQEVQQQQGAQTTPGGGAATGITPEEGALPSLPSTMFQSNIDGIRVGVPNGWVFEDLNNTDPASQQAEQSYGAGVLVELCPQNQATPQIGGTYVCPDVQEGLDSVSVWRFADLKSRPEFAGVVQQNQNITTTDLVAYYFLFLGQKANFTNFRLLENIDTTVNVIDPQTNETITTAPAKYIETTYQDAQGTPNNEDFALLVLSNDGNTSYALLPVASLLTTEGQLPIEHQMVFDTFELIAKNSSTNATTTSQSTISPFGQRLQQQEQGPDGNTSLLPQLPQSQQQQTSLPSSQSISGSSGVTSEPTIDILEGSSIQGNPDYDPEELTVIAGSDVTVVNQDTVTHTVTYGTGLEDTNSALYFDTSLIYPGESIIMSLASELNPGRYDYYCIVHPYMTGTIIVER